MRVLKHFLFFIICFYLISTGASQFFVFDFYQSSLNTGTSATSTRNLKQENWLSNLKLMIIYVFLIVNEFIALPFF